MSVFFYTIFAQDTILKQVKIDKWLFVHFYL